MNTVFEKKRKEGAIVIYRREFIFSLQSLFIFKRINNYRKIAVDREY